MLNKQKTVKSKKGAIMSKKLTVILGKITIYFLDFPIQSGAYNSGGWSRSAKHKPQPELIEIKNAKCYLKGKSVYYKGVNDLDYTRRLKVTIIRNATGTIIREDYPLNELIKVGVKEIYPLLIKAN